MEAESYRGRVHKFSSKPPGHNAARQRENQRRHRARIKGRIAELEAALSSTQHMLADALKQVATLTAEVQRLQGLGSQASIPQKSTRNFQEEARIGNSQTILHHPQLPGVHLALGEVRGVSTSCAPPTQAATSSSCSDPITPAIPGDSHPISGPDLRSHGAEVDLVTDLENPDNDCPLLPAPGAGESTIPCRDAYSIIKERSTPDLDLAMANEWLKPGFRRAIVPGTGCRVQTHILFAFVDHLTPI